MKKKLIVLSGIALLTATTYSCQEKFLDQRPLGSYSESALTNKNGVEGALIAAYATLRGNPGSWYQSPMNWLWGSIRGFDSYKGSEATDQAGEINPMERFEQTPGSPTTGSKWTAGYNGVGQANVALRLLKAATDVPEADKKRIEAEARFIRGFHHFETKRMYNNIAFVDEKVMTTSDYKSLKNDADVWPRIMEDLLFAYNNLPETQAQLGRVNKWAAAAVIGKAYLYQKDYAKAKQFLTEVITSGKTNKGEKYGLLDKFSDVFKGASEGTKEMVFELQYTTGGGTNENASAEVELTNPHGGGAPSGGCCGFFQPTQNLVNAYKTQDGLPLFDTFNVSDVNNFESTPTKPLYDGELDPRLDWTVGRVGMPYLDYGLASSGWIRNLANGGPYFPLKNIVSAAEKAQFETTQGGWGQIRSGKNWPIIRFADVLLMAAEAEIETGGLTKAAEYVNLVRKRAANPAGFVKKQVDDKDPAKGFTNTPAANYSIKEYPASLFATKASALKTVMFERRLELAMEGHRFFDLVRWGIADTEINAYLAVESKKRSHLTGVTFTKGQDEYLPIPEYVINQSKTADGAQNLKQNPGY